MSLHLRFSKIAVADRLKRLARTMFLMGLTAVTAVPVAAEVYIYRGPNGERMISDRPMPPRDMGYELLTRRDSLDNAGHILADRNVDETRPAQFRQYIRSASQRYQVDAQLIEAIIEVESSFNPQAVSSKGASGLMQLMAPTAQQYKVSDRFNPQQNINAGVQHLKALMLRFNGEIPLVLAAYNAGAGAVERYRGIPPFPETRRYVAKVLGQRERLRQLYVAAD